MNAHLGIISTGRPGNVPRMEGFCEGLAPTWYVNEGEGADYRFCGADRVVELPVQRPAVARARDAVIEAAEAHGLPAVIVDDDLRGLRRAEWTEAGRVCTRPALVREAVEDVLLELAATPYYLGGISPTGNALYVRRPVAEPVKRLGFIRDFYVVLPGSGIRHDYGLELTEDYDFNIQHLERHGGMVRVDRWLPTFEKLKNRGGLQAPEVGRTPATIAAARARLAAKWPGYVTWPHPRKGPAEIDFRVDERSMM